MTYCVELDLIERFSNEELIQLTDRTNTGIIDSTILAIAITDASAEIDSYLAAYTLPLSVVPPGLKRIACHLARFNLYDDHVPETIDKLYKNSIDYLKLVAKGQISLGVDSAGEYPVKTEGAQVESGGRVFGRDDNGFL